MDKVLKTVNKFSGNFCFSAATDFGDVIAECDWQNETLSYAYSSKFITDVCLWDSTSYLVAFSDRYIGKFASGALDETYIDTVTITNIDKIATNKAAEIYILNRTNNTLYKYDSGIKWSLSLPDYTLRTYGNIVWKEIDGTIVFSNNTNIHVIRDETSQATLINSLAISGSGTISVVTSNGFNPSYTYARSRTVSAGDLDQTSSSSSISSESSSSVSSSSISSESSLSSSSESSSSISSESSSSVSSESSSSISSKSGSSASSNSSSSYSSNSSSSYSSNSSSSYSSLSSSSSYGDVVYICGEGIVEDCTGTYHRVDDYASNSAWARNDNQFFMWWYDLGGGTGCWLIGDGSVGSPIGQAWSPGAVGEVLLPVAFPGDPFVTYDPVWSVGQPMAGLAPCSTSSSSSSN